MQYVTYGDMFTFTIAIVGIIGLVFTTLTFIYLFTHKK